jgi:hypothetical protein
MKYENFYNTGFTITERMNGFFDLQYNILKSLVGDFKRSPKLFEEKHGLKVSDIYDDRSGIENFEYCLLEELSVCFVEGERIVPLRNYYLEASEDELESDEVFFDLQKVYFIHEHIEDETNHKSLSIKLKYGKKIGFTDEFKYYLSI